MWVVRMLTVIVKSWGQQRSPPGLPGPRPRADLTSLSFSSFPFLLQMGRKWNEPFQRVKPLPSAVCLPRGLGVCSLSELEGRCMNLGAFLLCASAWRAVTVLARGEAEARCGFRSREAEASRPDGQAHAPDSSASACGSPGTGTCACPAAGSPATGVASE